MIKSAHGLSSQHQNCISRTSQIVKRSEVLANSQQSTQNRLGTLCMPQVSSYTQRLSSKCIVNCRCSDIYEEHHREAYWRTWVSVFGAGFKCTMSKAQPQAAKRGGENKLKINHKYTFVVQNEQGSITLRRSCATMQSEAVVRTQVKFELYK